MSRPLCIAIHGFTGNPDEVRSVTDALEQDGYEVIAPLLPGHSYAIEQLPKVQAEHWIRSVDEIVAEGIKSNREIHMIGFSMGAMIAAIMTHRYSLPSLTLLSPAIFVVTPHLLVTRTKSAVKLLLEDRAQARASFRANWAATRFTPTHNVFQFRKIVRQARTVIPDIACPVCIVYGLRDEIVDPRSAHWIFNSVSSKDKVMYDLPQSGHLICQDIENDQVVNIVTEFVQRHSGPVSIYGD